MFDVSSKTTTSSKMTRNTKYENDDPWNALDILYTLFTISYFTDVLQHSMISVKPTLKRMWNVKHSEYNKMLKCYFSTLNNGVLSGVFTCRRVACEDAGWAAYSQLHLHITGEYNRQQAGISSETTEYVAHHPVYTQRVHSYWRSQKLEISSM